MPRSELVIVYPTAGEVVTPTFIARGTTPDSGVPIKVYLEDAAGAETEGTITALLPNRDGGTWLATFSNVVPGKYQLVALIETREDIQVHAAGVGFRPPGLLSIAITTPSAGGAVSNPITVYGTVSGPGCTITSTITSGGNQYNGQVTPPDGNGNWSVSFGTIPTGSATLTVTVTQAGPPPLTTTTSENVTVE